VFQTVNLGDLQKLSTDGKVQSGVVTPEILVRLGKVKKSTARVKILGDGDVKVKLDVSAHAFSKSAAEKITAAGGVARVITLAVKD
jgi:large subunit ribosomal protein L15